MKKYTFNIKNNTGNNFRTNTNWSKVLDNYILADVIAKNPYLKTNEERFIDSAFAAIKPFDDDHIIIKNGTKTTFDNEFINAVKFLKSYTPKDKYYELSDGTPIVFFEDEIQIGFDLIPRDEFTDFISTFTPAKKKTIIDIYIKIRH